MRSFKFQKPPDPAVIARHEAISRIARLIYYRGVSLVIATVESSGLGGEIASSFLLAMTVETATTVETGTMVEPQHWPRG